MNKVVWILQIGRPATQVSDTTLRGVGEKDDPEVGAWWWKPLSVKARVLICLSGRIALGH